MSTKPHYFAIGLFVLVATALGLGGIVALSSDAMKSPENFIETYVDESVQGIDIGTPFKLRGVKVGHVSEIALVSSVYETKKMYVMIRIALDKKMIDFDEQTLRENVNEQVDQGLRLKLIPQGITGLSFVEADLFPDTLRDPLEVDWEPKFIHVPSTPATMTLLSRSLERLSAQLDTLDLEAIGANIEAVTSNLNSAVVNIEKVTGNAADVSEEVLLNVKVASGDLPTITRKLTASMEELEKIMTSSDQDIEEILSNMRYLTDDARELIRTLKRNPGLLLSEPPSKNLSREGIK